ncbi:E3 ubiquitin-protein ligase TRIM32-like isoform X2 [Hyperolius riggenbachi]|uniref:E3 ubiquitin-protein ligase TRIM32-like isoform X2 n=1 Tax=Hyperolius riggenbachi TaxID=752182 RepID=UPI0035A31848
MHEFNKEWKLSGIQRIFYNSLVGELGGFGSEDGKFIWPTSVTNTLDGDLAIKDTGNQQIQIFSAEGRHKQTFSYGSENTKCLGDVTCTKEGLLLVSNGSKGIKVFTKQGEMIHLLKSSKADWKHSYGLAVVNSNSIAVTDWTDGGKVHIVAVDWRMNAILKTNVVDGLQRPEYIAVTKVYFTSADESCIVLTCLCNWKISSGPISSNLKETSRALRRSSTVVRRRPSDSPMHENTGTSLQEKQQQMFSTG